MGSSTSTKFNFSEESSFRIFEIEPYRYLSFSPLISMASSAFLVGQYSSSDDINALSRYGVSISAQAADSSRCSLKKRSLFAGSRGANPKKWKRFASKGAALKAAVSEEGPGITFSSQFMENANLLSSLPGSSKVGQPWSLM